MPLGYNCRTPWLIGLLVLFPAAAMAQSPVANTGDGCSPDAGFGSVQAMVGNTPIAAARVARAAGGRLLRLQSEDYNLRRKVLDELIEDTLLRTEAESRGVSVADLVKAEVERKVAPPTEAEQRAALATVRERHRGKAEEALLDGVAMGLTQQRLKQRRREFLSELKVKHGVKVFLQPPRVAVDVEGAPAWGPEDAPVTLLQFSDFECPYCVSVPPILKKLRDDYGDKLRIVFRHFPLDAHKQADKAAEAGACAQEQGKFWEMHDVMFANRGKLQEEHLKRYARDIGLNAGDFDSCLDSRRHITRWKHDRDDGIGYGVAGTPAFFVNGRPVYGMQPYDVLAAIVDEELSCTGSVR